MKKARPGANDEGKLKDALRSIEGLATALVESERLRRREDQNSRRSSMASSVSSGSEEESEEDDESDDGGSEASSAASGVLRTAAKEYKALADAFHAEQARNSSLREEVAASQRLSLESESALAKSRLILLAQTDLTADLKKSLAEAESSLAEARSSSIAQASAKEMLLSQTTSALHAEADRAACFETSLATARDAHAASLVAFRALEETPQKRGTTRPRPRREPVVDVAALEGLNAPFTLALLAIAAASYYLA